MKQLQTLLLAALLCCAGFATAQTDSSQAHHKRKKVYEMGIDLYALTLRPGDYYSGYKTMRDNQIFSGIYLKCFRGQYAMRFGVDYSQRTFSSDQWSHATSLDLKVGYQRMLGKRRLAAYVFADLEFSHMKREAYGAPYYSIFADYYNPYYTIISNTGCLNPGLGLRWKLGKLVVLNLESGVQLYYSSESGSAFSYDKNTSVGMNVRVAKLNLGFTF